MNKTLKFILALNLVGLAILAFVFPQLMVSPGKLIPGHSELEVDCFACHAPLTGAATERCTTCHKPEEIGKLTTLGQPIKKPLTSTPFHQKLLKQDCLACHSDHAGVKRYHTEGRFNHALLQMDARAECSSCHTAPEDSLHRQISGNCDQCHSDQRWKPATFDHDNYFVLDSDHNAECATCHQQNDYSRYSCYGCHEHTPENIRREHIEEGIRDYKNCAECHGGASERDLRMPGGEGGGHDGESDDD
jgi:hypothetical protein